MTHTRTVITLVYFFLSAFRLNTVCFLRQSCCDFSGRVCLTPLPDNESQTTSAGAPFIRNVYCRSSFFFFQFFDNSFCSLVLKWKKDVSLSPHLPLMATGCRCTEGHPSSPSETLMWWIKKIQPRGVGLILRINPNHTRSDDMTFQKQSLWLKFSKIKWSLN